MIFLQAFDKAIEKNPTTKPIFHSNRGFQNTNKNLQKKLKDTNMTQSISRVGHFIDNGPIEGFVNFKIGNVSDV